MYLDGTSGGDRQLRRQKVHPVAMSPLARLRWWRVVLDEAQMVGARMSLVSQVLHTSALLSLWDFLLTDTRKFVLRFVVY